MQDKFSEILASHGIIADGDCLKCDVCCRFPSADTPLAPFFSHEESARICNAGMPGAHFPRGRFGAGSTITPVVYDSIYRCPSFRPATNDCSAYDARPFDCRLYPFMLMYSPEGDEVVLGADTYCPAVTKASDAALPACAAEIAARLERDMMAHVIESRGIVGGWKEHVRPLMSTSKLSRRLCRSDIGLRRLTSTCKDHLNPFFARHAGSLSYHSFSSVAVWSDVFDLRYKISGDRLLIFAEGDGDAFLLVPPIGSGTAAEPAAEAAEIIRQMDAGAQVRMQEVDDATADELARGGWRIRESANEYIYSRQEMAELSGNRFEKKRALCNRFEREHKWEWRSYSSDDFLLALELHSRWLSQRTCEVSDEFFVAQAECSRRIIQRALMDAESLGIVVRALFADGALAGITGAIPLSDGKSFHVLFEISDLNVRGAAQFMFRELCRELRQYEFVNAGSDSGLQSLRRVKESYRPVALMPARVLTFTGRTAT